MPETGDVEVMLVLTFNRQINAIHRLEVVSR